MKKLIPSELNYFGQDYEVTMMLEDDWMMGGVSGKQRNGGQFKVGTIYWNSSIGDSLAWLMVPTHDVHDVRVTETTMEIHFAFLVVTTKNTGKFASERHCRAIEDAVR